MHRKQPKLHVHRCAPPRLTDGGTGPTSEDNQRPNFLQRTLATLAPELHVYGVLQHVPVVLASFTQHESGTLIPAATCTWGLFILFAVL